MLTFEVRPERPDDNAAIHRVHLAAFGRPDEADLVDNLRANGKLTLSFVAVVDGEVLGHIAFSPVRIVEDERSVAALGLAPVGVLPEYQSRGIGSTLIRTALQECQRSGHSVVILLGHPEYYPRFGFVPGSVHGVRYAAPVPDEAFMVWRADEESLTNIAGVAHYSPEFDGLD